MRHHHSRRSYLCGASINLRLDDRPILDEIQEQLGFGNIRIREYPKHYRNPMCVWAVEKKADCVSLVEVLEEYPLRAKKAQDFIVWREGVSAWRARDHAKMAQCLTILKESRSYKEIRDE